MTTNYRPIRRSSRHSPHFKKKAFTLLELVVALVVLAILAVLSIPTYTSVISSSKTDVATATAISVSDDAVAIAATTDQSTSPANIATAPPYSWGEMK